MKQRQTQTTINRRVYRAMCSVQDRSKRIQHYRNDLYTIDRETILTEKYHALPSDFGWIVRSCGTFLFLPSRFISADDLERWIRSEHVTFADRDTFLYFVAIDGELVECADLGHFIARMRDVYYWYKRSTSAPVWA